MGDKQFNNDRMNRKLELVILGIVTAFSLSMFVSSFLLKWHLFAKELIVAAIAAGWFVTLRKYRDHIFRAKFIAVMAWINFSIYVFYSVNFHSVLSSMMVVIVLLGAFCITEIVWLGVFFSTFVVLYQVFVLHSVELSTLNEVLRLNLHVISMYVISLITWMSIRARRETSELLVRKIHELEIVERSKDDFMINISHEIRTPVNAVCGMSEAILQEKLPTGVRKDVIDIQTAGRNLLATVSNILDFSELESGRMELVEESYNITSTITDIINMALSFDNGRHLELIVDCDANLPGSLVGDEQKLRRIVMNLLENAFKFTREGGIVFRIKSRKEEYGVNLIVSIRDSGIGMSREETEQVFNSFGQLNAGRNREEGGIGLGLAITQALVRSMGGFMTVESEPDSGTEFRFSIPQKVLDDTPIVSIKNRNSIFAACYVNMDKYEYSVIRDGYEKCIRHMVEQFGVMFRACRNFSELKRRMEHENYSHLFIGWEEYCEDRHFFEQLAGKLSVVIILNYGQETQVGSNMLRIYKPFTVLSIAAVLNGQRVVRAEEPRRDARHRFIAPEAKVLVVDDNAMNLKVMSRLLLPYQIKVTTAISGEEALEKLNSMEYDCVYLDHMMPELDGVETLHKIRQKPGAYFQSLPVIAFTANAIGGAREMFMEEGFDDFIAKPIELSVLERMLCRYIPVQKQIAVEEGAAPGVPGTAYDSGSESGTAGEETDAAAAQHLSVQDTEVEAKALEALQQAGINIRQALIYCGDRDGLREFIGMYHAQGAKRSEKLEQLFREQDWTNYVITVHALKSNSKGIGADQLAELAYKLEMAGKENRIEYITEHHGELMEKHAVLLRELAENAFIYPEGYRSPAEASGAGSDTSEDGDAGGKDAPAAEREADPRLLEEQLGLLRDKLDNFESDGLEQLLGQLGQYTYQGISMKELTAEIGNMVADFDFLGACGALDSWEAKLTESTARQAVT